MVSEPIPEGNDGCPLRVEKAATTEVVEALMRVFRELPSRPAVEEVEAAVAVLAAADAEEMGHLAEVAREEAAWQQAAELVPRELLTVLGEARCVTVRLRMLSSSRGGSRCSTGSSRGHRWLCPPLVKKIGRAHV